MIWILIIAAAVFVFYRWILSDGGHKSSSGASSSSSSGNQSKPVKPYPMASGATNPAIGAVDRCCEFAAFCIKYVIPEGVCTPERLEGHLTSSPQMFNFGFNWKTNFYSLDTELEKQGYSIQDGGFAFSDYSGLVSFANTFGGEGAESAYAYLTSAPTEQIIAKFEQVAANNFTSLGLPYRRSDCRCTHQGDYMEFKFTV